VKATFALAQSGSIQIEMVSQLNRAPSAYHDTVPEGGAAFHHVALYCHDYDADLRDEFFGRIRAAAADWSGADPVRAAF